VASSGTSVLIAEHDLDLLERIASRVVIIRDGRIVARDLEVAPSAPVHAAAPSRRGEGRDDAAGDVAIRCANVAFRYPDGTPALDDASLEIRLGESVAIVGRNGSGKTTLARHLNGLLRPTSGTVEVAGRTTDGRRVAELARVVGLTFQEPNDQLFARTCREEVAFGARNVALRGAALQVAVMTALDAVGLGDAAGSNPYDLGPSRRRLLAIASVLAMRTPVVVLDEPTVGLDDTERARVGALVSALANQGRTVVAISHDARFVAESCGRIIRMEAGRIVHDGPATAIGSIRGHSRTLEPH
jgi:energy-coupling factor transport system ATP-binding protein